MELHKALHPARGRASTAHYLHTALRLTVT